MSHNIISVDGALPNVKSQITAGIEYIQFGQGEIPSSPSITVQAGAIYPFYDTAPLNTIDGATISTTNDILDSITLPAGKYIAYFNCGGVATSGPNYAIYNMMNSSSAFNGVEMMTGIATYFTIGATYLPNWFHLTSTSTIFCKCSVVNPVSTSYSTTNDRYAKNGSLCILKVG